MRQGKRIFFLLVFGVVGLSLLLAVASFLSSEFLVDLWWFDSLGFGIYFWQRLLYRYLIFASVTVVFFLIFFLNFWVASRYLGTTVPPPSRLKPTSLRAYKELLKMFRTGSMWVYTPLSLAITIPVALPLFHQWEAFLFYLFGTQSGIQDPVYGKDIAYYLFELPIYSLLIRRLLLAFLMLLVGLSLLYWLEKRFLSRQEHPMPQGAKWHLNILIVLIFLIGAWDFVLQLYLLLYDNSHEPLFSGPGFVEMRIIMPSIWACLILLVCTAISLIYVINTQRRLGLFLLFAVLFLATLGSRYSTFLPALVEKYLVKPNEISYEKAYIQHNIQSTLNAYKLTDIEYRDFAPERLSKESGGPNLAPILRNIPVWDGEVLKTVYQQLQQLRTYYVFPEVSVGRYTVNGNYQQVFLAARELNYDQLPPGARNWINEHLSYTHGYGAVMTPAAQGGGEPMTWFMQGIPPQSNFGIDLKQPGIYYGDAQYQYAIVPNRSGEIDYPKGSDNVMTNYQGKGIPIDSLFRKLVFASYLKEKNIFFTTKTYSDSNMLIRRNITERIKTITPFLNLDPTPYLVITPDKLYWIQDAYVTSTWYPYSKTYTVQQGQFNYIRNSVKIVIDAYDGTVDYYIWDTEDPIISAYNRFYTNLFKRMEDMPSELKKHVRYPRDLFDVQMDVYAKYHQTDPEVFYQQEDLWVFPTSYTYGLGEGAARTRPYYLTLDLIENGRLDFLLIVPMLPKGQQNLRALPIVGCDSPHYGKIIIYNFPKGELVYGPSQIYALIDQDTTIAQQFSLWDQVGSEVGRGKMIILPVGKVILYIQPVYLKSSTQVKIPQLQRLIMSEGQYVVMGQNLEEDYSTLQAKIAEETERVQQRFAPFKPPSAPSAPPMGDQPAPPKVSDSLIPPAAPPTAPESGGSPPPQ
jgi:uncharacterized membrane protein (UPF0182 family)